MTSSECFPLKKLPYVPLRKVLHYMETIDIIELSLTSFKVFEQLKSVHLIAKEIEFCAHRGITVSFRGKADFRWWHEKSHQWRTSSKQSAILRRSIPFAPAFTPPRCQMIPTLFTCFPNSPFTKRKVRKVEYDTDEKQKNRNKLTSRCDFSGIRQICEYLMDLFHSPLTRLTIYPTETEQVQKLASWKAAVNCEYLEILFKSSSDDLKFILKTFKPRRILSLESDLNNDFTWDDPFDIDNIYIENSFWVTENFLLNSNFRVLRLQNSRINSFVIRRFIKLWMEKGDKKLQRLQIHTLENISMYEICNGLTIGETWNRPKWHRAHGAQDFNCENGIDVIRKDGTISTIVFESPNNFHFVVWY